ncbi:MAG: NUDIX hydrolase [Fimbriimonadaceae bacterium]|nr:NUDIX hydrolase [Alphaproteobacteria bacterium]
MIARNDSHSAKTYHPYYRPRDAATLIVVDTDSTEPRVLMGKRHERHRFLPGKYVFPGARIDPADYRIKPAADLKSETLDNLRIRVTHKSANHPRGLALAAIRELFEETGLLLGELTNNPPVTRSQSWKEFFACGVVPKLDQLNFITRAVTPPGRPRRFDTRFFMADSSQIAKDIGLKPSPSNELLEQAWMTFAEARTLDIPGITRFVLDEVEHRLAGDHKRPIPFFRPKGTELRPEKL